MKLFAILASAITCANAFGIRDMFEHTGQKNLLCKNPEGLPTKYTGFRLSQVAMYDWPVRHFWHVAKCSRGKLIEQQFFPADMSTNFMFGESVCLSKNECYIISRRRKYAQRKSPIYRPFVTIGAIYKYDPTTNRTAMLAIMKSDNAGATITPTSGLLTKRLRFTPVLFSSEGLPMATTEDRLEINPFEIYNYTSTDKHTAWWNINKFVNRIISVSRVDDGFLFWEFDALQQHLCNEMGWRDRINLALASVNEDNGTRE